MNENISSLMNFLMKTFHLFKRMNENISFMLSLLVIQSDLFQTLNKHFSAFERNLMKNLKIYFFKFQKYHAGTPI